MMSNAIISFIVAVMMTFAAIPAGAQTEFLTQPVNNYTAEYSVKMTFDSSKDVLALLKEVEMPEEIEYYVDVEKLFESLFSVESNVFVQADISEDMKKAQLAMTTDDFQTIDVNKNLNVSLKSKTGLWMVYDFSDIENPVYEMVISAPLFNKYMHMDLMEIMTDDEKQQFIDTMAVTLNKEFVDKVNSFMLELLEKYAEIEVSLTKATIKISNEGLISIIENAVPFIIEQIPSSVEDIDEIKEILESMNLDGLQLLGEDGINFTYTLKNGRVSAANVNADFSLSIANLYTLTTGEEWEYISEGKLNFTFSAASTVSKIGTTKVEMPSLTDENSFSYKELVPDYYYEDYELEPIYPKRWVYGDTENLPVIDGNIYFPLRAVLENAYEASVQIAYENGVITVTSEYFPEFTTMVLTVGSDKVYLDGTERVIGTVINENGVVYADSKLFTDVLGWYLENATYYVMDDSYYYSFDPYPYPETTEEGTSYEPDYPNYWIEAYPEKLPVVDGDMYVPLRVILENGYEESVQISYENGIITVASEYFPGFKTMVLTVGSDKIYLDGAEKTIGTIINENGTVYVNSKLFTEIFGWKLVAAEYDMTNNSYWCEFYTP